MQDQAKLCFFSTKILKNSKIISCLRQSNGNRQNSSSVMLCSSNPYIIAFVDGNTA